MWPEASLRNTPQGIEFAHREGLEAEVPGPASPLELTVPGKTEHIYMVIAAGNGATVRKLCHGSGACALAVKYKIGSAEKSIYLVRTRTTLLLVSPDPFNKVDDNSSVLANAAITGVGPIGGPFSPLPADGEIVADFKGRK
jgi:hypothetical protein